MKLCAPIKTPTLSAIQEANQLADLVEWRFDLFHSRMQTVSLRSRTQVPLIVTIKSESDLVYLPSLKPDFIDVPYTFSDTLLKKLCSEYQVIISYHEKESREDLEILHDRLKGLGAKHVKLAIKPTSVVDALRFILFVEQKKCLGVTMGENGKCGRLLAPFFGSAWCYAPISQEQATAPGQMLLQEYVSVFKVREFTGRPVLFGLIGNPLDQSQGEFVHNFLYSMLEIPALYLKLPLQPDELTEFLELAPHLGFRGLSVTSPYKQMVGDWLGKSEAMNTLLFDGEKWQGTNTDVAAALELLPSLVGKKVAVLGAGATGVTLALKLMDKKVSVSLFNRSPKWIQGIESICLKQLTAEKAFEFDVLINATSSQDPVDQGVFAPHHFVVDIASRRVLSPFLKKAIAKGCHIVTGDDFYYRQAYHQCVFWFLSQTDIISSSPL